MELITPILEYLLAAFFFLAGVAGLNVVSVEGVKGLIQWMERLVDSNSFLGKLFAKLSPSGRKTFFLSMITAFFLIAGLDMSVLDDLSQFGDVDITYIRLVEGIMAGLLSNHFHDKAAIRSVDAVSAKHYADTLD